MFFRTKLTENNRKLLVEQIRLLIPSRFRSYTNAQINKNASLKKLRQVFEQYILMEKLGLFAGNQTFKNRVQEEYNKALYWIKNDSMRSIKYNYRNRGLKVPSTFKNMNALNLQRYIQSKNYKIWLNKNPITKNAKNMHATLGRLYQEH